MWAYADQGSYKMTLRKTHKTWHKAKETAEKLKLIINEKFSEEKLFDGFVKAIYGEEIDVDDWLDELESEMVFGD